MLYKHIKMDKNTIVHNIHLFITTNLINLNGFQAVVLIHVVSIPESNILIAKLPYPFFEPFI